VVICADEAWWGATEQVMDAGAELASRDGDCREIVGAQLVVDPERALLLNHHRKAQPCYAAGELVWYLSGTRDGAQIRHYAPSYERFLWPDGTAHGAYGPRIGVSLSVAIDLLRARPQSRQAVVSIWEADDLEVAHAGGCPDVPCTLALQFLVRGGDVTAVGTMRSNDLWLGTPYDVFCFSSLQLLVAHALGLGLGPYVHQAGSLHLYHRHHDKARRVLDKGWFPDTPPLPSGRTRNAWHRDVETVVRVERVMRENGMPWTTALEEMRGLGVGTRWAFVLGLCAVACLARPTARVERELEEHVWDPWLARGLAWADRRREKGAQR
jgi:thymidylate synthase